MKGLVMHPRTKQLTELYLADKPHGILLVGDEGAGKETLARALALEVSDDLYVIERQDDKQKIGIEQIQQLYGLTKTNRSISVLVIDAGNMTIDAQNAFLKLLEEPPNQIRFVMTSVSEDKLLPTICSRLQIIPVLRPHQSDLLAVANPSLSQSELSSLIHSTSALPGRLMTILQDEQARQTHDESIARAKQFYSSGSYERFKILNELKYDRVQVAQLIDTLSLLVEHLISSQSNLKQLKKLAAQADLLETVNNSISNINGNPKIHLTRLALSL